jgi:hypothetical protein
MDFDKMLADLSNGTTDPVVIYIIGGLALIVAIMIFRKVLYIAMLLIGLSVVYFGFCYITGYEVNSQYIPDASNINKTIDALKKQFGSDGAKKV